MNDVSVPPDRGLIPWGAVAALGLVLAAESWVSSHHLDFTSLGMASHRYAGEAVARAVDTDVLALGDSQVKFGVVPLAVERRAGRRAYNLGAAGGTAPFTYYLLRRALDRGARPGAIIVDFKPTQLQVDPRALVEPWAAVLSAREALDMAWTARDGLFFAKLLVAWTLPSLRARAEIRSSVLSNLQGSTPYRAAANLASFREWDANRGAGLLPRNPAIGGEAIPWDAVMYDRMGDWWMHPLNGVYVRRVLDLAAARGVPVYWVVAPINPRVQVRRDGLGRDRNYTRMLHRAVDRYPNLVVIEGRRSGYPTRVFTDGAHMDLDGAYAFSDALALVLKTDPGAFASRWVELPPYRAAPYPTGLEDVAGSRPVRSGVAGSPEPRTATLPGPTRR